MSPESVDEEVLKDIPGFSGEFSCYIMNNQDSKEDKNFIGKRIFYNEYEWTEAFIGMLSRELQKRSVIFSKNDGNIILAKLSGFSGRCGWLCYCGFRATLSSPDGYWERNYYIREKSATTLFSACKKAMEESIKQVLKDKNFIEKIRIKEK